MRMKYLVLLTLLFNTILCSAQVTNIDRASQDTSIPKVFSMQVSATIDMDEQKNNVFDEDANMELAWQTTKNTLIFGGVSEIASSGPNNSILNSGMLQFRDRILPHKLFHLEPFAQYQFDEVKGLKHRYLGGMNLRSVIKDKGTFRMFAATGMMYEYEDWDYNGVIYTTDVKPNLPDIINKKVKSTSYARFSQIISKSSDISLVIFYQAQPEFFFKQHRIAEFCQFNFALSDHFSLTLEFDSIYDTDPVVPIKKFYFSFNEGLTFRL